MKSNDETSQTRKKAIGKGKVYVVEESDCVEEVSGSDSDSLSDQDVFRVQTIGTIQSAGEK